MSLNLPPPILQKVAKFKAMQHKDGKFLIWGVPCFISELYVFIYLYKLLEDKYGYKEASSILYSMGYLQAQQGILMVNKRFGYAKTIQDKSKLLDFNMGQSEMVGAGKFEWLRKDFTQNTFIVKASSSFADEYKRFFSGQKNPVDHYARGELAALVTSVVEKECICVETRCMALGNSYCEFLIKPIESWKKDYIELLKNQEISKLKTMKELGAKIEPYISL
jgi:predicted hydrocarbon binding protein